METEWPWQRVAVAFAVHGALGLAMHRLPPLATIHSTLTILAVVAISLWAKRPAVLLLCLCYVSGSEVLWRMSKAFVFHETAKYVIVLTCVIGLVRLKRSRLPEGALLYLLLLLPSIAITYYSFRDFNVFRKLVLFSLSGPLAITAAVCFCANLRLSARDLWQGVLCLSSPLMGVAAITLVSTYWREGITFGNSANFDASGGFGPNQVASALALGALLAFFLAVSSDLRPVLKALLLGVAAIFLVQSVMTFSRGGVASVLLALAIVSPLLVKGKKQRLGLLAAVLVIGAAAPVLYTQLNQFTGGKLEKRFTNTKMSGREDLLATDLALWQDNPVFGVGVGISRFYHAGFKAAHTEFSRAVAESGTLGALAYIVLGLLCLSRALTILKHSDPRFRPILLAAMIWAFLYMVVNANRTSGPALAMGLAFLTVQPDTRPRAVREAA
jgi:O-antigen ligase